MIYTLDMNRDVRAFVSHLYPNRKRKIKESLRTIACNPTLGKPLQDKLVGLYSYRVGVLHIVYTIDNTHRIVRVIAIGPRHSIYENLERGK